MPHLSLCNFYFLFSYIIIRYALINYLLNLVIVFALYVTYFIQKKYRSLNTELKRLGLINYSKVNNHISETVR